MVAKSVIEIDVNDEKFKEFQKSFEKYQKTVKEMQKDWQKVNSIFSDLNKKQDDFNKSLRNGGKALKDAASSAKEIATSLASSAMSIGKWLALGALGGGFGLGGLASSANDYRRQAQGLGITTGNIRAGNVAFGKFINYESTLEKVADMKMDLERQQILARLGGGVNQTPAEMMPSLLRNAVNLFKQNKTKQYAEGMGLTEVLTFEELRRLANNEKELTDAIKKFETLNKRFEVDDKDVANWQTFWYKLKESTNLLETSLIKNLTDLIPLFVTFTEQVLSSIEAFLNNKEAVKEFTDLAKEAGQGLLILTKAIFKALAMIPDIYKGTLIAGEKIHQWMGRWSNPSDERYWGLTKTQQQIYDEKLVKSGQKTLSEVNMNPGDLRWAGQKGAIEGIGGFAKFSSEEAGLRAMAVQLKLYQDRDKLDTLRKVISKYAPSTENNTDDYLKYVSQKTGIKESDKLDFNNTATLASVMSAMTKFENQKSNFTAQRIEVVISNLSGNSVNAVAKTLPGAQSQ